MFEQSSIKRDNLAATRIEITPFPAFKQSIQSTSEVYLVKIYFEHLKPIGLVTFEDFKNFLNLLKAPFLLIEEPFLFVDRFFILI